MAVTRRPPKLEDITQRGIMGKEAKSVSIVFCTEIIMWFLPKMLHQNTSYRITFKVQNYFDYSSCHPFVSRQLFFHKPSTAQARRMFSDGYRQSDRKAICLYCLHFAERLKWPFSRPTIKSGCEKSVGPRYKTLSNLAHINTNRME